MSRENWEARYLGATVQVVWGSISGEGGSGVHEAMGRIAIADSA